MQPAAIVRGAWQASSKIISVNHRLLRAALTEFPLQSCMPRVVIRPVKPAPPIGSASRAQSKDRMLIALQVHMRRPVSDSSHIEQGPGHSRPGIHSELLGMASTPPNSTHHSRQHSLRRPFRPARTGRKAYHGRQCLQPAQCSSRWVSVQSGHAAGVIQAQLAPRRCCRACWVNQRKLESSEA